MLFKKFVNLSFNLRICSTQLNVANSVYKFNIATKGKLRHISSRSLQANKLLYNQLNITVPIKVLECLLETNKQKVSGRNIIDATHSLIHLYDQDRYSKHENKLIVEKILYTLINAHKDKIKVIDLVEILKQLLKVGFSESSEVIQIILEMINNSLQDLEIKDFNIISETLIKFRKTHLTETIINDLKNNFIVKMSTDFDASNLDLLTEIFRYASNNLNDKVVLQIIIDSLKSDDFETMPITNAVSIMKSLCNMNVQPQNWTEVLHRIQNILINNVKQLTTEDIESLLHKTSMKIRDDRMMKEYYNASLLEHFAQKIVTSDIGFEPAVSCLRSFITMRHIPKNLLSYISAKHYEEKQLIYRKSGLFYLEKLICLVNGLACLKYRPIFWDEIHTALKTSNTLTFSDEVLVNHSLNLSSLDCYDSQILQHIFQAQYNYKEQQFLHWRLLHLWQTLITISNYTGPLPPQEMIDSFKSLNRVFNCPLIPNLYKIAGSNKYFKTNVRTKLHHQIDNVIAFDEKTNLVPINDDVVEKEGQQYLEDLKVSDNVQIVALLYLPRWWYLSNEDKMLGQYVSYVKSLETLTPHVIVVPEQVWRQLPEDSKTDYLKNEINSKLYSVT